MARAEVPDSLQEIRNPTSLTTQIAALKQLKHDIIGHDQRKELVICHGVIGALVGNLQDRVSSARGKRRSEQDGGEEDEVRVQSIQIITSLAHGRWKHNLDTVGWMLIRKVIQAVWHS
jgi:hypothetical protein